MYRKKIRFLLLAALMPNKNLGAAIRSHRKCQFNVPAGNLLYRILVQARILVDAPLGGTEVSNVRMQNKCCKAHHADLT